MATDQNIKDFFTLTSTNPPITDAQIEDLDAWLLDHTRTKGPDAIVDFMYTFFQEQIQAHKRSLYKPTW